MRKVHSSKSLIRHILFTTFILCLLGQTAWAAQNAPGKVGSVTVQPQVDGASLSWRPVKNADGYRIVIRQAGKKIKTAAVSQKKSDKTVSYTVSKLTGGTEYSFRIRAFRKTESGRVNGKYSKAFTFIPYSSKLAKPVLQLKSFREGTAVLEWEAVPGAGYYELYQKKNGSFSLIKKTEKLKFKVKNLPMGETYTFQLCAAVSDGEKTYRSKKVKIQAKELSEDEMRKLAAAVNISNVNNTGNYNASTIISNQQAECYANYGNDGKAFSSLNNYLVWVNLYSQRTFLFERKSETSPWTLMWQTPCITGKMGSNTPYGVYKFSWASPKHVYSEKDNRYAEYLSFFIKNNWSIHTFMYPDNDEFENHPETFKKGFMASEGCVRLPRKYAKSIFDHCLNISGNGVKVTETGSTVIIH